MSAENGGTIHIGPGKLDGVVRAPASKSFAHRALICSALAVAEGGQITQLTRVTMSKDIAATLDCLEALGFRLEVEGENIKVMGYEDRTGDEVIHLNCGESGSTLRFMIPLAAALGRTTVFTGEGRLPSRPIGEYNSIFHHKGVHVEATDGMLPLKIEGQLQSGVFHVSGNISSQYITGLLLALPLLEGDSEVRLLTPLESAPYIDITIDVLKAFGVSVEKLGDEGFAVKGGQKYVARDYEIEGDYSQAAFWLTANYLGSNVEIEGLNPSSSQGDKAISEALIQMGFGPERTIDVAQIPDLVPILAAGSALTPGVTHIINAGRLRIKESDRLAAVTEVLTKIGADIKEFPDKLVITGKDSLRGGHVHAWNDHRIAMMLAIVALRTKNGVTVDGFHCIEKSYPEFFNEFARLGGEVNELNLGK
ncbi:MAG: 3-phosphoshikimate 1-carboxyvinyltransferase [Bacillota bacterium]